MTLTTICTALWIYSTLFKCKHTTTHSKQNRFQPCAFRTLLIAGRLETCGLMREEGTAIQLFVKITVCTFFSHYCNCVNDYRLLKQTANFHLP